MISFKKKDLSGLHNIGDLLCTPDNYFDMQSDDDITVVGGGVWNIEKLSREASANKTVVWAAGRSVRYPSKASKINSLDFVEYGIRDRLDLSDSKRFLPCVSCLNRDIISDPISDKTLVFTNANNVVSPAIQSTNRNFIYLTNACTLDQFLKAWTVCDKVITNSYHGIYWSLLSGREVAPYGYSSKFTNVTAMFDIEFPSSNYYEVNKRETFLNQLSKKQDFISLNNHHLYLEQFRSLNYEFAERLKRSNVICKKL
jgi:hypothetical protein